VNPDHLFLGTPADNMLDRDRKNRHRPAIKQVRGEQLWNAKLNADLVRAIRADLRPHGKLAAALGLSKTIVRQVRKRQRWKHVED